MAESTNPDKAALLAEIASTRVELELATEGLRAALDVPARAKQSLREHRNRWISGAAVTGVLLALLRRRKKVVYVERSTGESLGAAGKAGMVLAGLKLVGGLAKPFVADLAKSRLAQWAVQYAQARAERASEQRRHS